MLAMKRIEGTQERMLKVEGKDNGNGKKGPKVRQVKVNLRVRIRKKVKKMLRIVRKIRKI